MGLAPYGEPRYADLILEKLMDLEGGRVVSAQPRVLQLLSGPDDDLEALRRAVRRAAAKTGVTADPAGDGPGRLGSEGHRGDHAADGAARPRGDRHVRPLPRRGRRAQLRRQRAHPPRRTVREMWIQPAAGDAGGALGVALFIWHQLLGNQRRAAQPDGQHGSLLGPGFSDAEIRAFLDGRGATYHHRADRGRA